MVSSRTLASRRRSSFSSTLASRPSIAETSAFLLLLKEEARVSRREYADHADPGQHQEHRNDAAFRRGRTL